MVSSSFGAMGTSSICWMADGQTVGDRAEDGRGILKHIHELTVFKEYLIFLYFLRLETALHLKEGDKIIKKKV